MHQFYGGQVTAVNTAPETALPTPVKTPLVNENDFLYSIKDPDDVS